MIVIGGDAIVDLIDRGNRIFEACPGGSTLNCALTSGQLNSDVLYTSTLSTDAFGELLVNRLRECQVDMRADARSDAPTSLAVVSIGQTDRPNYAFYREGTADREIPADEIIAAFPQKMTIFHVGACALIPYEDQEAWLKVALAAKSREAIISIDPNCRPSMTKNLTSYRSGIARFLEIADLIKLSDEDLRYLHPEFIEDIFLNFSELYRPALCVYTTGASGIRGLTGKGVSAAVPARLPGQLLDTVGAGDTVQGTLLSELDRLSLNPESLEALDQVTLASILTLATKVAGINCTRVGCQPPTLDEVLEVYS